MSNNQQNHNGETSSNSSHPDGSKMLTQAEYMRYKQEDSNSNNYYGFSKEATTLPVAWDGKFQFDPNNVYVRPNRNASSANDFYGFSSEPIIMPVEWDGTFAKSGETRLKPERNRSNDQKYF